MTALEHMEAALCELDAIEFLDAPRYGYSYARDRLTDARDTLAEMHKLAKARMEPEREPWDY